MIILNNYINLHIHARECIMDNNIVTHTAIQYIKQCYSDVHKEFANPSRDKSALEIDFYACPKSTEIFATSQIIWKRINLKWKSSPFCASVLLITKEGPLI